MKDVKKLITTHSMTFCLLFALLTFFTHLIYANKLGYFSDELYFIDCSRHLDFGYFDVTPLVPFIISVIEKCFGLSLYTIRIIPSLAHSIVVLLTGLIAFELGGKRFACSLAGLSVMIAPVFLRVGLVFVIPSLEPVFWTCTFYFLILLIKYRNPKLWLAIGLAVGLSLMTKPFAVFLAAALAIGLLISKNRSHFKERWLWLGLMLTILMILPNLLWQWRNNWITFEFVKTLTALSLNKNPDLVKFFMAQIFYINPINAPIWYSGIYFFLCESVAASYRILGWIALVMFIFLSLIGAKYYYSLPIYPMLLAGGSVNFEVYLNQVKWRNGKRGTLAIVLLLGIIFAPTGLPILSIEQSKTYINRVTLETFSEDKVGLFSMYSDMNGLFRDQILSAVAKVYHKMDNNTKAGTKILVRHYTIAAAFNVLGAQYDLPKAISGSVSYFIWGPGKETNGPVITVGFEGYILKKLFAKVEVVDKANLILICSSPKRPLYELWDQFRLFQY